MDDLTIRQIIERVSSGNLRVPAFQRGFVWESNRVAYLMDSIYKKYPFGSILLWRTKEKLKYERKLGPFSLPEGDPDYPVDYILDGQQRITSIFGVFQTDIPRVVGEDDWSKIYFDFTANPDAQESQFLSLKDSEFDPARHFLLNHIFDTTAYRKATKDFDDVLAQKIDALQSVFKEVRVPVQSITTEDRATVAIVFERVNQKGVELDTFQLLSAWTWSEDFDLQRKFEELARDLEPFGFSDLALDNNLILRCFSAILAGSTNLNDLVKLNGSDMRSRFNEITNGIKGAIDFLRKNLNISTLSNLPSNNIIIPLAVFFSISGNKQVRYTADQKNAILIWFWRTSFMRRYNSQTVATLQEDITQMVKLKRGESSSLGDFPFQISPEYFSEQEFRINTIASKSTILLLSQKSPLSLVSGAKIDLNRVLKEYNRNEFHHIFPQNYLRSNKADHSSNCLANLTFLSKVDNNLISDSDPKQYISFMPKDRNRVLASCIIPNDFHQMPYDDFIRIRSQMLSDEARRLMQRGY